ncbi:MAG: flavodoxin [Actinomycetota bacterium]|nr:flavodoxin [Actinomycetota bacterium]
MLKTLVAYWSQSGQTRRVAELVARKLGADLYEVEVDRTYDDDMWRAWDQAQAETASGDLPRVVSPLPDLSAYGTVLVGSGMWGMTFSNPVVSFLEAVDLTGKRVSGFWTFYDHDEKAQGDLARLAAGADVARGLPCPRSLTGSQKKLDAAIDAWIETL